MSKVAGMIPDKVANFNVYKGTAAKENRLLGVTDEITCPELESLTETINMAGFSGEFDSPAIAQYKNMEIEIPFTEISKENLAIAAEDGEPIIIRAAQEFLDPETQKKVLAQRTITIRGMTTKISYGKLKKAGKGDPYIKKSITCYKEEIDGEVVTDINKLTGDTIIAGVDVSSEIKKYI